MKIKLLLLTTILLICSCNSSQKSDKKLNDPEVIGSWALFKVTNFDASNLELDEQTRSKLASELLSKALMLQFFPDSSFTKLEDGKTTHGNWSFVNDKEIKYENNKLKIEGFKTEGLDKMLLATILNEKTAVSSQLIFKENVSKLKDYKKDPFYPENNKWRQRPDRKETSKEISERLSNYVLHNAYILQAAHERGDGSVSFANSRGIIKIFQGGIGVVKENKIHKSWMASFYDNEDAMKAYNLYTSYLDKQNVIRAKSTGDWVKDDYKLLFKLHARMAEKEAENDEKFIK